MDTGKLTDAIGRLAAHLAGCESGKTDERNVLEAVGPGADCYNGTLTGEVAATIGTPGSSVNASGPTVLYPTTSPTIAPAFSFKPGQSASARTIGVGEDIACTLESGGGGNNRQAIAFPNTLSNGTGTVECSPTLGAHNGGTNGPAVAFEPRFVRTTGGQPREEVTACLRADTNTGDGSPCVAFDWQSGGDSRGLDAQDKPMLQRCQTPDVLKAMQVRRLTPEECEILQGFPRLHTKIPWKEHQAWQKMKDKGETFDEYLHRTTGRGLREPTTWECPDGPRYKAIGNSMAVNVMCWIGERIAKEHPGPLRYLSLCSGIEAATTAWHHLGWTSIAFSEIEPFPCAVLAHHWPDVPNLGDMTKWETWGDDLLASVDLLVGGTPCQAFSVAGLRQSLGDARGNLTLTYARIINAIDNARRKHGKPPAIIVWENVPGVLNTKDNAFGCFLGALSGEDGPLEPPGGRWTDAGCVSGPERTLVWRCLDAQYFGLAQRRKRVFVVGSAGTLRPEQVLFEREGVQRHTPPGREARKGAAPGAGGSSHWGGGPHPSLSQALRSSGGIGMSNQEVFSQRRAGLVPCHTTGQGFWQEGFGTLRAREQDSHENLVASLIPEVADTLRSGSASPASHGKVNGTDRVTLVPVWPADIAPTLNAAFGDKQGLEDQHALAGGGLFVPATRGDAYRHGLQRTGAQPRP